MTTRTSPPSLITPTTTVHRRTRNAVTAVAAVAAFVAVATFVAVAAVVDVVAVAAVIAVVAVAAVTIPIWKSDHS